MDSSTKLYVCYEPEDQALAEHLSAWPCTNTDREAYHARQDVRPESPDAEPIKRGLRQQIRAADVTVCIISQGTFANPWIEWELTESRAGDRPNGLVGIVLHEGDPKPPAISNCGAIFVPFSRDKVERAIEWAAIERGGTEDFILQDD